ncbi:toll/interleukin-1 receptor domain-containing protein [Catenuloplanes indicus]|uniref:TIR domain-containing protein n=1 Tax=Catenuloplanes indicus TaxID=137267 RepID=A0AAE3W1W3_9ACTN|nr:toll/interleukin-1 receptor domain-containing protein [Catenuloplanes indicus]MDQ0366955.1 hypothetical protein [Catenuloplanes indicus]
MLRLSRLPRGWLVVEPKIFVSYRKADGDHAAVNLDTRLARAFGEDAVFMASRSIEPGRRYKDSINLALKQCKAMLVVIGPHWLTNGSGLSGERLVDRADDWVRHEIREAFRGGLDVVPVFLDRCGPIAEADLPDDIASLAGRQYMQLRLRRFEDDVNAIIRHLRIRLFSVEDEPLEQSIDNAELGSETVVEYGRARAASTPATAGGVDIDLTVRDKNGCIRSRLSGRVAHADLRLVNQLVDQLGRKLSGSAT